MNFKERLNPTTTTKVLMSAVPRIIISKPSLIKMFHYVQECSDEIGWLGTAERDGQYIYIHDVYLFHQEVHATTTEITPEGLSDFAVALMEQQNGVEIWNNLKLWGHSHVNMGITPSAQDDKQMETFQQGGHDWFIRLIANKKGEMKLDLYDYENGIIYTDIPWMVEETQEEILLRQQIEAIERQIDALKNTGIAETKAPIQEEIKVKVKKKTYSYGRTNSVNNQVGFKDAMKPSTGGAKSTKPGTSTSETNTEPSKKKDALRANGSNRNAVVRNIVGLDWYQNDDDVVEDFEFWELVDLGRSKTLIELEGKLYEKGFNVYYTEDDLERILRVAYKKRALIQSNTK